MADQQLLPHLSAAVFAVPLSRALGLGSIIGYLAAGIAIGPWGLGLVTNVQGNPPHFAEFGVVLMLFSAGLELEPKRLWKKARTCSIFGWGSAQVLGCVVAIFGVALAFGTAWPAACRRVGSGPVEHGDCFAGHGGAHPVAHWQWQAGPFISLFQDVAAIPILALLPLLANSVEPNRPLALVDITYEAIKVVAVIASIVIGGRLALRPLLRWIAHSKTPEIFTAASLLLVVGIAALMQRMGLSMALAPSWPVCCWQKAIDGANWKPISSRSRACFWDCSSLRWAWG